MAHGGIAAASRNNNVSIAWQHHQRMASNITRKQQKQHGNSIAHEIKCSGIARQSASKISVNNMKISSSMKTAIENGIEKA